MANLVATTSGTVSATTLTSPKMLCGGANAFIEYVGSISINNGVTIDLLRNDSGYGKMIGFCNYTAELSGGRYSGIFTFSISRYELEGVNSILNNTPNGLSTSYRQESDPQLNWIQFTNNTGQNGTFYFNIRSGATVGFTSTYLTRVK
jgi:hypothetical protein